MLPVQCFLTVIPWIRRKKTCLCFNSLTIIMCRGKKNITLYCITKDLVRINLCSRHYRFLSHLQNDICTTIFWEISIFAADCWLWEISCTRERKLLGAVQPDAPIHLTSPLVLDDHFFSPCSWFFNDRTLTLIDWFILMLPMLAGSKEPLLLGTEHWLAMAFCKLQVGCGLARGKNKSQLAQCW